MRQAGIAGEVVVADNGSTDESRAIATAEGRAGRSGRRSRVRRCPDGRDRSRARAVRHHGGRRRQLRFRRGAEVRRAPPRRVRPRPGLPARDGRRTRAARRHAAPASLARQPDVLADGAALVPRARPRYLLRHARLHEGVLPDARPTVHRDGVRDRDDHQGEPARRAHRRGAHHPAPRRPQEPPAASEDVPRRLAHAALLPDVHAAPAVPDAGADPHRAGPRRIHGGDAGHDDRAA